MHSKRKRQHKESTEDSFNETAKSSKTTPLQKIDDPSKDTDAVAFLNFSEDSFTHLTEEILNCSTGSDLILSKDSISLPSPTVDISSSIEYSVSPHEPTVTVANFGDSDFSTSVIPPQSLSPSLEEELFPSSIEAPGKPFAAEVHLKCSSDDSCIPDEPYETNSSDNMCNVNEMVALKELESQLFSACFCSVVD